MTVQANALTRVHLGVEGNAPGTTATSFMKFGEMDFSTGIMEEGRDAFVPTGDRYPALVVPGKEFTEIDVSGPVTFFGFPVLLSMMLGGSVGSAIGTDSAYRWTHSASGTAATTPVPFTLEEGDAYYMHRLNYVHAVDLSVTYNRDGIDFSGKLRGRRLSDNPGFTTNAPSAPTLIPVLPETVSVYLDNAGTALGVTKLTRVEEAKLNISGWYGPSWFLNASNTSWDTPVNLRPTIELEMTMQADGTALARLTDAQAATRRFIRIEATSATLAGTAGGTCYYSHIFDAAVEVKNFGKFTENQGIYSLPITFSVVNDPTWGTAFAFRHVNRSGTIGSYP